MTQKSITGYFQLFTMCNTGILADLDKCSVVFGIVETSNKNCLLSQRSCKIQWTELVLPLQCHMDRFGDCP